MARAGRAAATAEREVDRLEKALAQWRDEAATKRAELTHLEASLGDQVLEDTTGTAARRLHAAAQDLRIVIAGADAAADSAERKLRIARAEVFRKKAAEVRERAEAAHRAVDAHQARIDALLRQLKDLNGVDYQPREPEPLWMTGITTYEAARSDVLRLEAEELDAQVAELETQADAQ